MLVQIIYSIIFNFSFFFFNDTATTEIYTLSLHDALPIYGMKQLKSLPTRSVTRKAGELLRIKPGPSQVKRLGHAVMMTPGAKDKIKWYREMFGFIPRSEERRV